MSDFTTILQGQNVSIGYQKGKKKISVSEGLSFSLSQGHLTCLLGPNGVGKSTLIKSIMGQLPCLAGQVIFQSKNIQNYSSKDLAQKISVVLTDKITSGNLTVRQLVSLGRTPFTNWLGKLTDEDESAIMEALEATKTSYLQDHLISEISDGQLQKVMIARALAQDGELIILDEPTAHLDLINRYEIMHLLRHITQKKGKTILVVTHDLDIAIETADELWLMQCGDPLVCGCPEDLILSGEINRLLSNGKLVFDKNSGKIRPKDTLPFPQISGPENISQWLKLALLKNKITLPKDLAIRVEDHPVRFHLTHGAHSIQTQQIKEVLAVIKNRLSM